MELLQSIGLNHTIAFQFFAFLLGYIFLYNFAFKPYLDALQKRTEQTEGQESQAELMMEETDGLNERLSRLQKDLNNQTNEIFSKARSEANSISSEIINSAKTEAENYLSNAHQKIAGEVEVARASFEKEVPELSATIVNKLLGRNI